MAMVGIPPRTFSGDPSPIKALVSPCLCGLSTPVGPFAVTNIRSIALNALSSCPTVKAPNFGANVTPSRAAASGALASRLRYSTGRAKLNPGVNDRVTVPSCGHILTTLSCTNV